jgi:HK97 family phage major capsid protein
MEGRIASQQALLAVAAQAPAETTVRQPLTVQPRSEQDPKRGFASIGDYAIAAKNFQGARSGRYMGQVDPRMLAIEAETQRFLAREREEMAKHGIDASAQTYSTSGYSAAAPTNTHMEGHSEDGLMVPPEFRQEIWRPAFELDDLLSLFQPQTTSSPVVQFAADETTPWGAAGIQAYWVAEAGQLTRSRLATQPRECRLHKAAVMTTATSELLEDTTLLTSRLNVLAPQAIGWLIGEALIRGTGAGKPLGWENSPALVTVNKETNQAANTILPRNVLNMAARVIAGAGSRLVWLNNRDTIPEIASLKIGNEPSWTNQNGGMREAPNGNLLGSPIFWTEHAKTLGTTGDIGLINLAGYVFFVHSGGTKFDSSIHLYFDYDISAFRWIIRVGGMPYLSQPITPANGGNTRSHFVYLQTRA